MPKELDDLKDRIISSPFMEWKKLPELIASVDINLAPLEDTLFNAAKSENKWVEASMVGVPTIASNIGAFAEEIEHGVDGILCANEKEWEEQLQRLINDEDHRRKIGEKAYKDSRKRVNNLFWKRCDGVHYFKITEKLWFCFTVNKHKWWCKCSY